MSSRINRITSVNYLERNPDRLKTFDYVKKLNNKGAFSKEFKFSGALLLPDNYFDVTSNEKAQKADRERNARAQFMSYEELMQEIQDQKDLEAESRERERRNIPQWVKDLDWNILLTKRIFKSTFI